MRHIIIWLVIVFGGFITCISIMIYRGIFSPFWSLIILAVLAGLGFIAGILLSPYSFNPGNLSTRKKVAFYAMAVAIYMLQFLLGFYFPAPLPIAYCSPVQQGQSFSLAPIDNGIGVTQASDGEFIGISNGSFAFDTGTANNDLKDGGMKCAAAGQFANGDTQGMQTSWQNALTLQTNDAEELIYQENQKVVASGAPYVTIVVATMLTGNDQAKIGVGRDTLQGIYTAQLEHNTPDGQNSLPNGFKVRILIANAGNNKAYVTSVAQQIIQLAHSDPTFVGVVGWNFSAYAAIELPLLNANNIPMILPTASKDTLLSGYAYAHRITPTSNKEARIGTQYIREHLHSKRILLFTDYSDDFSGNLADDFIAAYGNQNIVYTQTYSVANPAALKGMLGALLVKYNPDLIYFAGYPDGLIDLAANQLFPTGQYASLKIMGADSLYEVNAHYPPDLYKRLLFTAAAFPDVWQNKGLSPPPFNNDYAQNFDPNKTNPRTYGWSRADADSILSYDALLALLDGCTNALNGQPLSYHPTPQDVEQELNNVIPFEGASGLVSLQDDDGTNPSKVNKVIVMLTVDQNGYTQIQQVYGCLTPNYCYT